MSDAQPVEIIAKFLCCGSPQTRLQKQQPCRNSPTRQGYNLGEEVTMSKCKRHNWVEDKRIGCRENPGIVSLGGSVMARHEVCKCGRKRIRVWDYVTGESRYEYPKK